MSISKSTSAWFIAPLLGFTAMVLPVIVSRPVPWYDAPLFPLLRNAQEHLGLGQLALFFVAGVLLGLLNCRRALLLGLVAIVVPPAAALAEIAVDSSSHNLLPFEIVFYGFYGVVVALGIVTVRRATGGDSSSSQEPWR
jgi:hypothetical protein